MSFTPEQLKALKMNAKRAAKFTPEQATNLLLRIGIINAKGQIAKPLRGEPKRNRKRA